MSVCLSVSLAQLQSEEAAKLIKRICLSVCLSGSLSATIWPILDVCAVSGCCKRRSGEAN